MRSEEHTSELQSLRHLVCRLLLEKKKKPSSQRGGVPLLRGSPPAHYRPDGPRCGSWDARKQGPRSERLDDARCCFVFFFINPAPPEISPFPLPEPFPF